MKTARTNFTGDVEDAADFADEWSTLLGSPVQWGRNNPVTSSDSWFFEAQVTQDQIDELDMESDWIIND